MYQGIDFPRVRQDGAVDCLQVLIFRQSQYRLDVYIDPVKKLTCLLAIAMCVGEPEPRILSYYRVKIPHKERVTLGPACFSGKYLFPVDLIGCEFATKIADMITVRLIEVKIT